jgi:MYXO-CTERM domain-containing protein
LFASISPHLAVKHYYNPPVRINVLAIVVLACGTMAASCSTVHKGAVFVDRNGDGKRQSNENGVAGAVVTLDHSLSTTTDSKGEFSINALADDAIVWVRVPDGFRPGPVWQRSDAVNPALLGVVPFSARGELQNQSFVIAADSHVHVKNNPLGQVDFENALSQAVNQIEPPMFFAILGDITQGNEDGEFDRVDRALQDTTIPWVPVPGNHDWYDGGATWRRRYGPDNYSFDIGIFHFVVWDSNMAIEEQIQFFKMELSTVDAETRVVALGHDSPRDETMVALNELGVKYIFTGHWHSTRVMHRGDATEWGTGPLGMGGIDESPAGYRVVHLDGSTLFSEFWPTVNKNAATLGVVAPDGKCTAPDQPFAIQGSLAIPSVDSVWARIDCGPPQMLAPAQAMTYLGSGPALAQGKHTLHLEATRDSRVVATAATSFSVCANAPNALGGMTLAAPVESRWLTNVGGNIGPSAPVTGGNAVLISVTDYGQGNQGGVVALAADDGNVLWRYPTMQPVLNSVAVDGATVLVPVSNGELHAIDLVTGSKKWQFDLHQGLSPRVSYLWSTPTVKDGIAYSANPGRFVAIRIADGTTVINVAMPLNPDVWLSSRASVLIDGSLAIVNFSRRQGMIAFDRESGRIVWRNDAAIAVNASPLATPYGIVYISSTGEVTLARSSDGSRIWSKIVTPEGFDWGYSVMATPTLWNDTLLVPTLWNDIVAMDLKTGTERWRYQASPSILNFAHYRGDYLGFASSVVVANDIVWVAEGGGMLTAIDPITGIRLWQTNVGSPLAAAPTIANNDLYVAGFDGTVRAMSTRDRIEASDSSPPPACPVIDQPRYEVGGGGCSSAVGQDLPFAAVLLALFGFRKRRRIANRRQL